MKHWKLRRPRGVVRTPDGREWVPDGATPYPLHGWNFARLAPARIGWWIDAGERFVTLDSGAFSTVCYDRHWA